MRKILLALTMSIFLFGCAGNSENETAASQKETTQETEKTDETKKEEQKSIEVDKKLLSVEITIPAEFMEEETQESLDQDVSDGIYKSAKLNDDGSVTIVISKDKHEEMMKDMRESLDSQLQELASSGEYSFDSIEVNDDYTHYQLYTSAKTEDDLKLSDYFGIMGFYMYSGMYHAFNGTTFENIDVDFINKDSREVIYSSNYNDYIENQKKDDEEEISKETNTDVSEEDIEIIAEYTLPDGIGWYTRRYLVIKNNSSFSVDISTSTIAYDENGEIASVADSEFYALGPGCTSIMYEAFETETKIDKYDMEMDVNVSDYYEPVIQDLTYKKNSIDNGFVFQVTNNGEDPAQFVEGYVLFFKGEELVDVKSTYFTDDDFEIKPEKTISEQISYYDDFDNVEFYLTGRK